jgi:hypothetical protein
VKRCNTCGQTKPLDKFHRCSGSRDGRQGHCADCQRERAKRWRARPENQARERERLRRRYEENRDQLLAYAKQWYQEHREGRAESYRRRRDADLEVFRARGREGMRRFRERHGWDIYEKRKLVNYIDDVDRAVVFERDRGVCGICGEGVDPADFHVDHIVPLLEGGEHSYANVRVAHPSCNVRRPRRPSGATQPP